MTARLDKWSSGRRPYLVLSLLCALLFLPGIRVLPPTDRDEARYVQATRQMLETGEYTRIRFQETPRHKKPIGIYWLQAASVKLLSTPESRALWPYRLPSLLAAWLAVLLLFHFGRTILGDVPALLGAGCLASTILLIGEAHLAKTDASLLASVMACQGVLGLAFLKRGQAALSFRYVLLFWIAAAAGVLIKGPVLPLIVGLTGLSLLLVASNRRWIWQLKPLLGIPLALLIVLPWFIAIQGATEGHFVKDAWLGDVLPKLIGAHESHGGFPGYYLLLSSVTFWPWSLFLVPAVVTLWRNRRSDAHRFLLAWLVPSWVVLELVPTKLPHYVLPLYPVLALAVGALLAHGSMTEARGRVARLLAKAVPWAWMVVTAAFGIACAAVPAIFAEHYLWWSLLPAAGLVLALVLVVRARRHTAAVQGIAGAAGLASLSMLVFLATVFPYLSLFWSSVRLVREIDQLPSRGQAKVVIAGYQEPSAVFLLGTDTLLTTGEEAGHQFHAACPAIAVVAQKEQEAFGRAMPDAQPLRRVKVFNYSKGKWMELFLYERRDC